MTKSENPVIGTFHIDEIDGKKYKMMVIEELTPVEEDFEVVSRLRKTIDPCKVLIGHKEIALALINAAIREENQIAEIGTIELPNTWWWSWDGEKVRAFNAKSAFGKDLNFPYQAACCPGVIGAVINQLGSDIFRIACGIEK